MHRFKFNPDDLFINRLKTYPEYNVFIYQGRMHLNRASGSGGLVVYDVNRNRTTGLISPFISSSSDRPVFKSQLYQPLMKGPPTSDRYNISAYWDQINGSGRLSAYPATNGIIFTETYSTESPISRKLTSRVSNFQASYWNLEDGQFEANETFTYPAHNVTASALQVAARKYTTLSPHFIFSGSNDTERTYINSFLNSRNLIEDDNDINFIFIPSMYYGSSIKKGSVQLNFYITGSKLASCADINHNGELIGTTGSTSGHVVGLVMYDEGVILLTSSLDLETGPTPNIRYNGDSATPSSWLHYGTTLNDGITFSAAAQLTIASASYDLNFKGTTYVNTMTMFAHARKGHLNHSNNPTYRDLTFARSFTTGSGQTYAEGDSPIANVVSASYVSASFEKTTYISKVHIYDEDGNLIAITSMAKPVKKELEDEFTFKMKLDL